MVERRVLAVRNENRTSQSNRPDSNNNTSNQRENLRPGLCVHFYGVTFISWNVRRMVGEVRFAIQSVRALMMIIKEAFDEGVHILEG